MRIFVSVMYIWVLLALVSMDQTKCMRFQYGMTLWIEVIHSLLILLVDQIFIRCQSHCTTQPPSLLLSVFYDQTVRNASGGIVQFVYGDDGLDPVKMEGKGGHPLNLDQLFMKVMVSFNIHECFLRLIKESVPCALFIDQ